MRKSSQKLIAEKLTQYLNEHNLKVVHLRKDEVKNTSYEEGGAVIVADTVDIGSKLDIQELIYLNHSDLSKNDLFFDFLKYSQIEKSIKQDDFIEFLKNTYSYSFIEETKKAQHYHLKLYNSISEENYLAFLSRPSYIVGVIADLPSALFTNNDELFNKIFNIALNTKAFKNIDFQTSTYKFLKDNHKNMQNYDQYFNQLNIESNESELKITSLESIKIELNTVSFATFNMNKTYSFTQVCSLIEYYLDSIEQNMEAFKLETFNYCKNSPSIIMYLSAPKLENNFYDSFILNKVKEVLSENEIGLAIEKTRITPEEIEKAWLDFSINDSKTKKNKIKI